MRIVGGRPNRSTCNPFNMIKTRKALDFILKKKKKNTLLIEPSHEPNKFYEVVVPRNFALVCFGALHSATSNKMNQNGVTDCYY